MNLSKPHHQRLITVSVMLATIMQALDGTRANVALPHMQAALSATQDQISWVLTSYIVASAIFMPLTGFLTAKFGRKRLFIWSVIGFTITSMLCGAAQSLSQMVLFRLLQGLFGASLVPLSQAVLLDTYPKEQHGSAMAIWGVGVMVGPILGPSLGGWLTEYYNWRWVFYINLPFGCLACLGILAFVGETERDLKRRFDLFGFILLSLSIGALQMLLDRGELLDWFSSPEIIAEAILAALCFYLFIAHIYTAKNPFITLAIFKDRNFTLGLICIFTLGIMLLGSMALLPPFLQNLMGYPVLLVGYTLAPRGLGTMAAMIIVGKLSGKTDIRYQILFGVLLTSYSLFEMTHFNMDISSKDVIRTGIIQGIGFGFLFVPLSTVSFSTLNMAYRNEATALFSLVRSIGSSIGISIVISKLSQNSQINHAALANFINPSNLELRHAVEKGIYDLSSQTGVMALNSEITRQSMMLAYLQDFRFMMWLSLCIIPLVFLLDTPKKQKKPQELQAAME